MTPAGNLSTASALSGIPPRVKPIRFPRSPLESPQPARPRPGLSGWTRCPVSTFRASLLPRAARAHLRSRCEPQVRGVADVASVTTSCSPGVRRTGVDLRHLSRWQPQYHSLRPHPCQRRRVARTAGSSRRVIAPGHPVWQLPFEPQGMGGWRQSPPGGAALWPLRSGHGSARWKSRSRWTGTCAEFIRERREVGAGALGPGPGPWEVGYGMTGVSAAHRCF